jgi:uncharacterized protein YmfQ (DUF2313 family)
VGTRTPYLAEMTQRMFRSLPPYFQGDDTVEAILQAAGLELQRVEDFLNTLMLARFPQNADDTYGLLGLWEHRLGLPVEPPGVPLQSRRDLVLARLQGRNASSGADWVASMNRAMGTASWSYTENAAAYQVTIKIPYLVGGFQSVQVLALANDTIPAHVQVLVGYEEGWLAGISLVGLEPL